jgi:hypothetical protein
VDVVKGHCANGEGGGVGSYTSLGRWVDSVSDCCCGSEDMFHDF